MSVARKVLFNNFNLVDENNTISLCRICLEDGARIPIFEIDDEDNYDIITKLSLCLREKIEDVDGYPRFICNLCSDILDSAYNFINKYKDTCKILQSGIEVVKQENDVSIDNGILEEVIQIDQIKDEIHDSESNDGFSDDDKEFLAPLKLKIKLKVENNPKAVKRKGTTSTNTKQVTNKIASSILEGQFAWNGDKWCLKSSNAFQKAKEKLKLLTELKAEPLKKKRVKIEVPKVKKSDQPKLCDLCGEVFKTQDKLALHKRKVHYRKAIKCQHCAKMLSSKYYLHRHIKRKHVEHKDFICATCGRGFAFKTELRNHNRTVHEKHLLPKKQYKCKFCSKTYKCPKSVIVHERSVHTGHRPAVCSVCTSSFYHEDYLKEHMRLHTGETPFKCPICGRGYAQRGNMKSHLRIHRISELDATMLSKIRPNYLRLLKA
ncbi:zinc finger protein 501-like isoform X1 [Pararge aegeria]|uniref:zinc finger protein 501-like isoform X1 n=1 Tax=Pararge aegeria TaxID=116150 RepID=UPI0019CF9E64|nr:zinc finger protein 501-like isoform X1 [Pararge aegeria]